MSFPLRVCQYMAVALVVSLIIFVFHQMVMVKVGLYAKAINVLTNLLT